MRIHSNEPRQRHGLGALAVLAVLAALAWGCGSSTVAEHWRDASWSGPAIRNMLVVVVRRDPVRRRLWEDAFAAALQKRGILATPSYRTFPDSVPSEDALQQAMKDLAFEGILLSHNTGVEKRQSHVPPMLATVGARTRWNSFYGAYLTSYRRVYRPGYTEVDRIVTSEVTVWDARQDGRMVWSATTASENPLDPRVLRKEITTLIAPRLAKDGIIP